VRGTHFVAALVVIVVSAALLLGLEAAVRWFCADINHQDTERGLFSDTDPGRMVRWRPNATGVSFGVPVVIDRFGYRAGPSPERYDASWLLLGDSVTFGVGVESRETFAGRLQEALPHIKVWNTAVLGYSAEDYEQVLQEFLASRRDIREVMLFFCLNDIDGRFALESNYAGALNKLRSFLRRHSKLYLWLKKLLTDRSREQFMNYLGLYAGAAPEYRRAMDTLDRIAGELRKRTISFVVVILPSEYQLRERSAANLVPQRVLAAHFAKQRIAYLDAYPRFAQAPFASQDLFLYGDGVHFSKRGHELVFRVLEEAGLAGGADERENRIQPAGPNGNITRDEDGRRARTGLP
jgi:lysophospholipase L1-like esterase